MKNNYLVFGVLFSLIISLIISYTLISYALIIPILIIAFLVFFSNKNNNEISFLYFLLPFSVVLKIENFHMTLYSIILIVYSLSLRKNQPRNSLTSVLTIIIFYTAYNIGISIKNNTPQIQYILKSSMYLIILYLLISTQTHTTLNKITNYFTAGLISSSAIGLFRENIPKLDNYITDSTIKIDGESDLINRFSGLWNDPNIYSILVLFAISCNLIKIRNMHGKPALSMASIAILFIFGLMTLSKTFVIGFSICMLFYFFSAEQKNMAKILISTTIIIYLIIALDPTGTIDVFIYRFSPIFTGEVNASSLTTNRSDIWITYIDDLTRNNSWIFGNGLNSELPFGRAAHNSYLEILYSIGIIGITIYITCIYTILKVNKNFNFLKLNRKNSLNYLPVIIITYAFFSLDLFKHDLTIMLIACSIMAATQTINKKIMRAENIVHKPQ